MIRMALEGVGGVGELRFDLQARSVTVLHQGSPEPTLAKLEPLASERRRSSSGASVSRLRAGPSQRPAAPN